MHFSTFFWAVAGLVTLGMGLFLPQLNRLVGAPSQEEKFTVPKFKRTAQLNGRISRALLVFLGLRMIVNGVGSHLMPQSLATIIAYTLLALAFLSILLMIIITTTNWRA